MKISGRKYKPNTATKRFEVWILGFSSTLNKSLCFGDHFFIYRRNSNMYLNPRKRFLKFGIVQWLKACFCVDHDINFFQILIYSQYYCLRLINFWCKPTYTNRSFRSEKRFNLISKTINSRQGTTHMQFLCEAYFIRYKHSCQR